MCVWFTPKVASSIGGQPVGAKGLFIGLIVPIENNKIRDLFKVKLYVKLSFM